MVACRSDVDADVDKALAALAASGWIQTDGSNLVALPSATHRDTVMKSMNDVEFVAWHRAAARAFERRDRPLAAASAAVHYVLAGDADRARDVARLAAARSRAIGLEATAQSFERLSEHDDIDALTLRNCFGSELEAGRPARTAHDSRASDTSRGSRRPRASAAGRSSRPARGSDAP